MAADKAIKSIIGEIEGAINAFEKRLPSAEKRLLAAVLLELKALATQGDRVLNSVQNLKLLGKLRNRLGRVLASAQYGDHVVEFAQAFDTVAGLQRNFFAGFNQKFKPAKTLPIIQEMAVDQTLNDLIGQGLQKGVIEPVIKILSDNITSGGSYASLTEQLRSSILSTDDKDGLLRRHARTVATDSINQFSAQYHETIAQDLNFNWGRYVGSNITTTREFCILLEAKEWVHKSELPSILEGQIDGHQCKLSKSTGLPLGMIPGTTPENFKIRRGGYNCGHQFFWVPDTVVPDHILAKFKKLPTGPDSATP